MCFFSRNNKRIFVAVDISCIDFLVYLVKTESKIVILCHCNVHTFLDEIIVQIHINPLI